MGDEHSFCFLNSMLAIEYLKFKHWVPVAQGDASVLFVKRNFMLLVGALSARICTLKKYTVWAELVKGNLCPKILEIHMGIDVLILKIWDSHTAGTFPYEPQNYFIFSCAGLKGRWINISGHFLPPVNPLCATGGWFSFITISKFFALIMRFFGRWNHFWCSVVSPFNPRAWRWLTLHNVNLYFI